LNWQTAKQICKITRIRTEKIKGLYYTSTNEFYYITSLSREKASSKRLFNLIRNHWQIENNLHWVKDNLLNEDKSTIRKNKNPQKMACIRNFAISTFHKHNLKPKQTLEKLANKLINTLKLIS
jgi:predicted transposase YbfD/YdcC